MPRSGSPVSTNLVVMETGNATLTVSSPMIMGGNAGDFMVTAPMFPINIVDGGSAVNVTVECTPSALGARMSTLQLSTNDPNQPTVMYPLTCTGAQPGYGSNPAPGGTLSIGSAVVGNSVSSDIVVSETGNTTLTVSNPTIMGGDAGDFMVTAPMFPFNIMDGGGSVNVTVECTPSAAGARMSTLEMTTNDPNQATVSYTITCNGLQPGYGSSPSPGMTLAVGSVLVGNSVSNDIVVSETGDATLTVSNPTIMGGDAGDFMVTAPTFPFNIMDGGGSVNVTVECTPSAAGARMSTLELTTNDPNQPTASYPLTCTGLQPGYGSNPMPGMTLAVGSATVGNPVSADIVVSETGDETLTVSNPMISGGDAGDFMVTAPMFPFNIMDGGGSVNITVECTPGAQGARSSTLQLTTNDPNQAMVSYPLTCTGLAPATPGYGSAPPAGSMLMITTPETVTGNAMVVISETGDANLDITSYSVTGGPEITVSGPMAPFTIMDGGASETLTVSCLSSTAGPYTGTLTVNHNAAGSPATYMVDCTVTPPAVPGYGSMPAPGGTLNMGVVAVGGSATANLTVSETGTATLDVSNPMITGMHAGDFMVTAPAFPFSIADGGMDQIVTVECAPSAAGARSAMLELTTNDPMQMTVSYSLTCVGTQPGYSSNPAPGNTLAVGSATVGSPVSTSLSVSESGNATLTVSSPMISGAHAADFIVTAPAFPFSIVDGGLAQLVTVECTPSAQGARTASLQLTTNDPGQATVMYPLTCTGLAANTPGYGSMPPIGSTLMLNTTASMPTSTTVVISETGDADLTVMSYSVTGGPEITVSGTAAPFTIVDASNLTETLTVGCSSATAGTFMGTLTVNHNAVGSPATYTVDCTVTSGGGTPGFDSTPMAPGPISFGSTPVGGQTNRTVLFQETGTADLTISNPVLGGADAASFQVITAFPVTVVDGSAGEVVTLACAPVAAGALTATLTVSTDDPANPTVVFDLTCTATGSVVAIPTATEWGLVLLAVLLSLAALWLLRRQVS